MPWDLRWADNKDLEFSPSLDIALTSGEDLIQQRILLRLIMMRGWIYDTSGELGSNLWQNFSQSTSRAAENIPAMVLEALSPMEKEITIQDVIITNPPNMHDEKTLMVIVEYTRNNNQNLPSSQRVTFQLS